MLWRERALAQLSEADLKKQSLSLKYRARTGEALNRLLVPAYALVREAAFRQLGMRHFPVQVLGGVTLHFGGVAEMQTGEGKTLTAALPLYLNALVGNGAHLATANDYLAQRDADWLKPVYESLGLSVGVILSQMPRANRQQAYAADITYGTAKEFGFDFLRDRLLKRRRAEEPRDVLGLTAGPSAWNEPLQRGLWFALVDEADSVLIDDARTPLILSALPSQDRRALEAAFRWAAEIAPRFQEPLHFRLEENSRAVRLTVEGRRSLRSFPKPPALQPLGQVQIYEYVERAIQVGRDYLRDRQYLVRNGEVVIIDESTGRIAEGRKWRDGVHQAVEAKENLPVKLGMANAAQITIQQLFRLYHRLAGMTGTARSTAREFSKVYSLKVVPLPTHRPCCRRAEADRLFQTTDEKWTAIIAQVRMLQSSGRPVLIGTRSIDKSEALSERFAAAGIDHALLHAKNLAKEAEIIAEAGQRGRVTVATNMAGRGTDIQLGAGIADLGGLYVICTELHDSARIDRQLIGRCARQGDPGSYARYLAWEDDVLRAAFGEQPAESLRHSAREHNQSNRSGIALLERAQRTVERKRAQDRRLLLHYVKQRTQLQTRMGLDPYLDTPG